VDETTASLEAPLRACWVKANAQKRIPAHTRQRPLYHLFGAYNWAQDQISWLAAERKNSECFIAFLEHVFLKCYPTEKIVMVMDNVSYHRSAASRAALSLFEDRVTVFWLPPYCPDLNPIERYWRHLKDLACANRLHASLEKLAAAIEKILSAQNQPFNLLKFQLSKNFR
jgi:putative transposase